MYRPSIDRIPGGYDVTPPEKILPPEKIPPLKKYPLKRIPPPEKIPPTPKIRHPHPPCEQNLTHVQKHYLGQNFVSAGKNAHDSEYCNISLQRNQRLGSNYRATRMHFSRMCTARLLNVSHSLGLPFQNLHFQSLIIQECITVGCVPPDCWPYSVVSHVLGRSPLDAHPPVMWPVMHVGKSTPSRGQANNWEHYFAPNFVCER